MWPAKRAGWACKPRIAALRASSRLRPTVRYSVGSPGKRKRHRGQFPDRSVTVQYPIGSPGKRKRHRGMVPGSRCYAPYPGYKYHCANRVTAYRPSAKPRRRYAPSSAGWRRHWPALHPGYRWYIHAEYRIQPVLMHHPDIGGKAAGNPNHRDVKTLRHLSYPPPAPCRGSSSYRYALRR